MIQMIDLAKIRLKSLDEGELASMLTLLVGQPFLSFQISYGDELQIHLGQPITSRRLKTTSGSYIIGTRASSWSFRSQAKSQFLANSDPGPDGVQVMTHLIDLKVIERESFLPQGTAVEAIRIFDTSTGFGFGVSWTDRSEFILFPAKLTREDENAEEVDPLADWEVFLPGHRLLSAGPGRQWSYTDSSSSAAPVG